MSRTPPTNLRSLEARLRNLGRDLGIPERRLRRLIGIVVLGQLLARTSAAAIKGASNIEVRVGTRLTRVSSDVDAVRRVPIEEFADQLARALREGWGGFTGLLVDEGDIPLPAPVVYRPHRFRAKLAYRGRDFGTVWLEVAPEEVDELGTVDTVAALDAHEWFAELGLPAPGPIPALPLEHQIAQKLHACTTPDSNDWSNDRAHDLVDLQLALRVFDGTLADIRQAAVRLFATRRGQPWPPAVSVRDGWEERYASEAEGLSVIAGLEEAVAWANQLIASVDAATPPH